MLRYLCVAVVFLAAGTASAEQEFKRMPWHLVDIWWEMGEDQQFESYAIDVTEDTLATADYGSDFSAIAEHGNFQATQFHPERSGKYGARLLRNFLRLNQR